MKNQKKFKDGDLIMPCTEYACVELAWRSIPLPIIVSKVFYSVDDYLRYTLKYEYRGETWNEDFSQMFIEQNFIEYNDVTKVLYGNSNGN